MEKIQQAREEQREREERRLVTKIKEKVSQLSPKERKKWWKTEDTNEIFEEISRHLNDSESYGHWLESTIVAATTKLEDRKNQNVTGSC